MREKGGSVEWFPSACQLPASRQPVHCRCHILALIAAGGGMPSLETEAPGFKQDILLFA